MRERLHSDLHGVAWGRLGATQWWAPWQQEPMYMQIEGAAAPDGMRGKEGSWLLLMGLAVELPGTQEV